MKAIIRNFLLGLAIMVLLTYLMGLFDDAFKKSGDFFQDLIGSFRYYFLWVLPYWWFPILIGAFIIAGIVFLIKYTIKSKNKRR